MAIRVNVPQRQGGRGLQINPIQARGRQLQAAAPAPPKQDWSAVGKSMMGLADQIKESRQKANRAKLVQSLVAGDDATEADAFDAPAPMTPTMQTAEATGLMAEADAFDETPAPPTPIAPATPTPSALSQLNMPDKAKTMFKELVNSGDTDGAYKIAMAFAMKPAKEYTLSEGQRVTDAKGKVIAEGAPKTFAPTKLTKPTILYDKTLKQNRAVTVEEQRTNPTNFTKASDPSALVSPDGTVNETAVEAESKVARAGRAGPKEKQDIEIAKNAATEFKDIRAQARGARKTFNQMVGIGSALDRLADVEGTTGVGREELSKVKSFLNTVLGEGTFDESVIASEELVIVEGGKIAMTFIEQTKGAITERENAMFKSFAPNLTKTPQGNRLIIAYAKASAEAQMEASRLASQYRAEKGTFDDGFDAYLETNMIPYQQRLDGLIAEARNMSGGMTPAESAMGGGNNNTNNVVNNALSIVRRNQVNQ